MGFAALNPSYELALLANSTDPVIGKAAAYQLNTGQILIYRK